MDLMSATVPVRADRAMRALLGALLYFPSRTIAQTPGGAGLAFEQVEIATEDGERLYGWWIPPGAPMVGHVLFCHGNAGNIGNRLLDAVLLCEAGFSVLL